MAHYALHAPFEPDPRFVEHYKNKSFNKKSQAYASLVEGIDKSLGDIISHVKQLGLGENTVILFLGENGSAAPLPMVDNYSSSAPLKGKKRKHWEGGMRVPFIAAWVEPNDNITCQKETPIERNSIQQQIGSVLDLYSTLCKVANISPPENHISDGFLLQTQLSGKQNTIREDSFLNHFLHKHNSSYFSSLVKSDWKIIYHYQVNGTPSYELYNLKEAPFEVSNLEKENPLQLKIMLSVLKEELDNKNVLYPEKEGKPFHIIIPELIFRLLNF